MKKLLLIPALLFGNLAMATDYDYEITPLIGYNIAEGNTDLDNYATFGAEFQYNALESIIKPELSVFYSKADYSIGSADTDIWRLALNGVYEYDKIGAVIPLAKAGLGYENMSKTYTGQTGNTNGLFVDAGVGAKVPFSDALALKLEAVYMLKHNDNRYDNNLAILAGLNIAFGAKAQKAAPVKEEEPAPVVVAPVDGDDDNDGVLNSQDVCPNTPAGVRVDVKGCFLDSDDDNDGVLNASDKCPNTPRGDEVDASGCTIITDDDNDGVLNSMDKCPATPAGHAVNEDGCPASVNLHINFENNSYKVDEASQTNVQKFADFLNTYNNYSAKIVGYTDSKGSEKYNQKLSEKRANVVRDMLLEKGVAANRVVAEGMGELNPVADNSTAEGKAQNRRIEAELIRN